MLMCDLCHRGQRLCIESAQAEGLGTRLRACTSCLRQLGALSIIFLRHVCLCVVRVHIVQGDRELHISLPYYFVDYNPLYNLLLRGMSCLL